MAKKRVTKKKPDVDLKIRNLGKVIGAEQKKKNKPHKNNLGRCGGAAYFLGFIGSAIYYISNASGFWIGIWGVIKSLAWPAILVFEIMKYLAI